MGRGGGGKDGRLGGGVLCVVRGGRKREGEKSEG